MTDALYLHAVANKLVHVII